LDPSFAQDADYRLPNGRDLAFGVMFGAKPAPSEAPVRAAAERRLAEEDAVEKDA